MITFTKLGRLGRFGNQLFQYTGTRLYAQKNGFDYAMPYWIGCKIFKEIKTWNRLEKLKSFFTSQIQLDDLGSRTKLDTIKWLLSKSQNLPDTKSLKSIYENPRDNISFYGYMQDEYSLKLLSENRKKIKEWFKFKPEIEEKYKDLIKDKGKYIALHIRKGDFVRIGTDIPTSDYRDALNEVKKSLFNHKIFVATNDPTVEDDFRDYELIKLSNPLPEIPDFIFDFWMLINANAVIGGGSTFSWWAAFLNENNTYYSPPLTHLWDDRKQKFQYWKL